MAPTDPRVLALHRACADYANSWIAEDAARSDARLRAEEVGCPVVSPGAGAVLRFLARAIEARAVVEVGTGAGVSLLWLLDGMPAEGVITSVDGEAEYQVIAREAIQSAQIPDNRYRLINGNVSEVLARLTEGGYDLVLLSGRPTDMERHFEQARTLLRPGGLLVVDQATWRDRVADPAQRDSDTMAMRNLHAVLRDNEQIPSALLPIGTGLLVAIAAH
jgi:predicted O-methyltransferase YrrM